MTGVPSRRPKRTKRSPSSRSPSRRDRTLHVVSLLAVVVPLALLLALFAAVFVDGIPRLSWRLLSGYPSRFADQAGLLPALVGSALLIALVAAMAVPLGVGAAVWFEEYGRRSGIAGRLSRLLEMNVKNLAGVPSVVYGILGLGVFVRTLGFGRSLIAGAATLALLVLPIIIVASREALRAVPASLREAGWALGATRWQIVRRVVLPSALPGITTSIILALSRAVGETAPLVVVGALTYMTFLPDGIDSPFTALPIQIWSWVSRPQAEFIQNGAAGVIVLLGLLLVTSFIGIVVRDRAQRRAGHG